MSGRNEMYFLRRKGVSFTEPVSTALCNIGLLFIKCN